MLPACLVQHGGCGSIDDGRLAHSLFMAGYFPRFISKVRKFSASSSQELMLLAMFCTSQVLRCGSSGCRGNAADGASAATASCVLWRPRMFRRERVNDENHRGQYNGQQNDSLWQTILPKKYLARYTIGKVERKLGDSHFWSGLMKAKAAFLTYGSFCLNNGK
jgi:hypothetical protein